MTWQVYRGTGVRPGSPIALPDPPPWRVFPRGDDVEGADYRCSPELVEAVNLSILLRRPLLLTGPAGVGKSSVAPAVAHELGLGKVLRWHVTSRTVLAEGLYQYDALDRLRESQREDGADAIERFIRLGPLGTALALETPRVLLIDELDKSDIDLPGDLLNVLERGQFDIPELARHSKDLVAVRIDDSEDTVSVNKGHVSCVNFPIIIITSNGERDFPPAFLRRCIRHHMNIPTEAELAEIVSAHLKRSLNDKQMAEVSDFAARVAGGSALAVDQLLNTVFLLAGEDATDSAQLESAKQVLLQELSGS